jgi:hypothetical protein
MRTSILSVVGLSASLLSLLATGWARASVVVNFDSVNAASSPYSVTGAPVTNYLSTFGISVGSLSNASGPNIINENYFGPTAGTPPYYMVPSSGTNMFTFGTNNLTGGSFNMSFSAPQTQVSFTRVAVLADPTHNPNGFAYPQWSVTALDSHGNTLGSVGESISSYFTDIPAQGFQLGPYSSSISQLVWSANTQNFAGTGGPVVDDLTISAVPEPAGLGIAAVAGVLALRRPRRIA